MSVARSPVGAAVQIALPLQCIICMDGDWTCSGGALVTVCGHVFHDKCLRHWTQSKNSCPVCRHLVNMSDCTKYTGANPKRYNTRQASKLQEVTLEDQPDSAPQDSPPSRSETSQANSRGQSPAISRLHTRENTPEAAHSQSVSAQALLAGLQVQLASLVREEVARGLATLRPEPPLPNFSRPPTAVPNRNVSQRLQGHENPHEPSQPSLFVPSRPSYQQQVRSRSNFSNQRRSASPIRRWQVRYDGDNSRLNIEEFIFRVETLTRNTLDGDFELLVSNLHSLLGDRVNDWYWTLLRQNSFPHWEHLKLALRSDWGDCTNDIDIRRRMMNRRQRANESFAAYCQEMVQLRNLLRTPMAEFEFVQNLRVNLLPSIQEQLCLHRTESVAQLRALVMEIQATRARIRSSFVHQPNHRPRVEEYYMPETNDEPEEEDFAEEKISAVSNGPPNHRLACWNCDVMGHTYQDCMEAPKGLFCFGCGRKGVVKPRCPECQPKNLRRAETNNSRSRPTSWTPRRTADAATSPPRPAGQQQ